MTNYQEKTVHKIVKEYLPKFETDIEKLNRKARKLDIQEVEYKIVGEDVIEHNKVNIPCYLIEVTQAKDIKVEGYRIVAKLERNTSDNFILISFDDDIPEELKEKRICEHCNVKRTRKTYYILKNEDDDYIMVGKTCLKDFLGNRSAEQIATYIEHIQTIVSDYEYDETKSYYFNLGETFYELKQVLQLAIYSIKKRGFKPSSFIHSTREHVGDMILGVHKDYREEFKEAIKTISMEEVQEVIDTILNTEATNDFMNNLKILIEDGTVRYRMFGYVVAMPNVADKINGKYEEPKKEEPKISEYVGTVGEYQEMNLIYVRETGFSTMYGYMSMYFFEDEKGNIVVWKTSKAMDFEKDEKFKVKAQIKEHSTYRDKKQTFIIRPKFQNI